MARLLNNEFVAPEEEEEESHQSKLFKRNLHVLSFLF